jgi:hypothetical protein
MFLDMTLFGAEGLVPQARKADMPLEHARAPSVLEPAREGLPHQDAMAAPETTNSVSLAP